MTYTYKSDVLFWINSRTTSFLKNNVIYINCFVIKREKCNDAWLLVKSFWLHHFRTSIGTSMVILTWFWWLNTLLQSSLPFFLCYGSSIYDKCFTSCIAFFFFFFWFNYQPCITGLFWEVLYLLNLAVSFQVLTNQL